MSVVETTKPRSTLLDALRGLAVAGMIAAHAIFFFHNGTSRILNDIQTAANLVVFTLFVFVAGAASSRSIDKYAHTPFRNRIRETLRYAAILYIGYAIVGILGVLTTVPTPTSQQIAVQIVGVLTLLSPTNFTEYVPLFILLPLTRIFASRLYRKSRTSLLLTIFLGAGLYAVGVYLYPINFPGWLNGIKELFAGGRDLLRFPLLFYMPVYLLGLWWEHNMEIPGKPRTIEKRHIVVMTGSVAITLAGLLLSRGYDIPILSPETRWPPSVGFLSVGLSLATLLLFTASVIPKPSWILRPYRFVLYLGRDAYDLWMTHLLFLFTYRKLIGIQFANIETVLFLFMTFGITTVFFSSLTIVNPITVRHFGRVNLARQEGERFRKRYGVFGLLVGILLLWSLFGYPTRSTYGNAMAPQVTSVYDRIKPSSVITITSPRTWHVRSGPMQQPIRLTLAVYEPGSDIPLRINPTTVTITVGTTIKQLNPTDAAQAPLIYEIPSGEFPPGTYDVFATVTDGYNSYTSNTLAVNITEPFAVAWTFDWEGWDASDSALLSIERYTMPLTHFVNPRTFLPDVLPPERARLLNDFLLAQEQKGAEIALHLHMQYDLVQKAGIQPRTTPHWGYLSTEGYDVPTSAYTPEEFRIIATFAKNLMTERGFANLKGFRAGGWFITGPQLGILSELGFLYDSSGRDKPPNGAFQNTPWDLPLGAQPYFPYPDNQNVASPQTAGILEIPTNGTTFDQSEKELKTRIGTVYKEGILNTPKAMVFVSHPQFASREFSKIPGVLTYLTDMSAARDRGPVIFVKTSDIFNLWTSSSR